MFDALIDPEISPNKRDGITMIFDTGDSLVIDENQFQNSPNSDAEPDAETTTGDEITKQDEKIGKDMFDNQSAVEHPSLDHQDDSSDDEILPRSRKPRSEIFDDESETPPQFPEQNHSEDKNQKSKFKEFYLSDEDEKFDSTPTEVIPKSSIKEICIETQRIARKATLSLPYHKPKQRGLLEFLNRKRACTSEGSSKPSPKDLPNILKMIEDRSHEAETFFASEDVENNSVSETSKSVDSADSTADISTPSHAEEITEMSVRETLQGSPSVVETPQTHDMPKSQQDRRHSLNDVIRLTKVPEKPKLFGRPGDILDLNDEPVEPTSKNRTGIAGFVELAMQQIALSTKNKSTSYGKRESITKTVDETNQNTESENKVKEDESLYTVQRQKFKEALQNSISEKRAAARLRKQQESKADNEEDEQEDEEELDYDELSDCNDEDSLLSNRKKKPQKRREDSEGEDANRDESASLDEEASSSKLISDIAASREEEIETLVAATPNFDFSPSGNKDDQLFNTQLDHNVSLNDVIGLCSGVFPATGKTADPDDEPVDDDDNEDSFSDSLASLSTSVANKGTVTAEKETAKEENCEKKDSKQPLSDDENSQNPELSTNKSRRKKLLPLFLSDDEDETSEVEDDVQSLKSDAESEADVKAPTDFFDKEAELSGSELGSDDEREDEEDNWEMEEGDKEDIDEDEVREQVGRTHLKTMLDDDQREVRLFQELFLEDGDLHSEGGGRKKQFKWNTSVDGLEQEPTQNENNPEDQEACDGPDEATWRKAKNEREKWLQEKGMSVALDDVKFKAKTVKIVNTKVALRPETKDSSETNPLLTSPTKNDAMLKVRRGSFLRRGEKELTNIANLAKVLQPVQAPTASSNFVFASLTPKRNATEKRKVKTEDSGVEVSPRAPPSKKSKIKTASKSVFSFLES